MLTRHVATLAFLAYQASGAAVAYHIVMAQPMAVRVTMGVLAPMPLIVQWAWRTARRARTHRRTAMRLHTLAIAARLYA